MKRLTYISTANNLTTEQLNDISEVSIANNQRDNITGVLLYLNEIFFQIIEGDEKRVDALYHKILADERHTDILCLKTECEVSEKMFPNWAMKTINLGQETGVLLQPVKTLLQTITESHRILEKYTQPSIANLIRCGLNPLTVSPRAIEKIIFFSDIVSFSTFTEKLPINDVVALVNHYLRICSNIISAYGGVVNKFMGDGIMASFNQEQVDDAIQAGLTILNELDSLRESAESGNPLRLLHTGIGLSYGTVIEGNMGGGTVKMDYTLLGDAVNVAARLESLTRHLPWALLMSEQVKLHAQKQWPFVSLGQHQAKGKQEGIEVYSLDIAVMRIAPFEIVEAIKKCIS
ncbi:MAG: BLUF domain-containing protein [Candidatus Parabeggiatoa sp.]|nr:BLUF domain-containing protein [Candidatus Parabeggiatoa sp.]